MPVPVPRWLLYRLVYVSETGNRRVITTRPHPEIVGSPVPAVLDSSWLASGEDLRGTPTHAVVQDLFDQGSPPAVEVLADHGAWGAESVDLGSGLVDEVDWEDSPFGGAAFRGRPGFTYSGETLDRVVFVRAGVLPADQDTLVVSLSRLDGFASVEEMLRADPLDSLDRVKVGFKSNVYASLRHRGDDYPAYLAVVAGLGLAEGMIPAGMVLGIWDVKGVSGRQDGEAQDFYAWESPLVRVLRASLVGTVIPPVPGAVWRLPDSGEDARDSSG